MIKLFRPLVESLIYSFLAFRCHQWCEKSKQKEKRDLKKEKISSPNNPWKSYLKTWGLQNPVGFWSSVMKLNPIWKKAVRIGASIKPRQYDKICILHKQIYKLEKFSKIGCFISSWEIVINFKTSKNNFKISIFAEMFTDFWQLFHNLLWIFSTIWKFIKTYFIRLITIAMHVIQIKLCNFVNQKMVEKNILKFLWFWLNRYKN